jgi:hypothetical protein
LLLLGLAALTACESLDPQQMIAAASRSWCRLSPSCTVYDDVPDRGS